jgi:hypothetical protein
MSDLDISPLADCLRALVRRVVAVDMGGRLSRRPMRKRRGGFSG